MMVIKKIILLKDEPNENESDDLDLELMEQIHKSPFEDLRQAAKKLPKRNDSKLIDPCPFTRLLSGARTWWGNMTRTP